MSWTDEYREIIEFYYWEPQHIGRATNGKRFANADEMYEHVNSLEVSLNHILNIFFSLYSLGNLDCFNSDISHAILSSWQLEQYAREQKNATQPDIFFIGDTTNIAIELKTKSKSNLNQVLKYAVFNNAIGQDDIKPLVIYFIAPYKDVSRLFKEKFDRLSDIYNLLEVSDVQIPEIIIITYSELYSSLIKAKTENETEKRLLGGLISYLANRGDQLNINQNLHSS